MIHTRVLYLSLSPKVELRSGTKGYNCSAKQPTVESRGRSKWSVEERHLSSENYKQNSGFSTRCRTIGHLWARRDMAENPRTTNESRVALGESHHDGKIRGQDALLFCFVCKTFSLRPRSSWTTETSDESFTQLFDTLSSEKTHTYGQRSSTSRTQNRNASKPLTSFTAVQNESFTTTSLEGTPRTR